MTALQRIVAIRWAPSSVANRKSSTSSTKSTSQLSPSPSKAAPATGKDLQNEKPQEQSAIKTSAEDGKDSKEIKPRKKTMAELDEELKSKLEGRSGDGGASGLEYEDGKASAMKRSVKNNMFRLI